MEILRIVKIGDLDYHEINEIKSRNLIKFGYNSVIGGKGASGFKHSDASKIKISNRSKQMYGENSGSNKVSWEYVNNIRNDYLNNSPLRELSKKYNKIAYQTIFDCKKCALER